MEALIELNEVNKVYNPNSTKVHALKDLTLKINKNDFIAIVGPSGSGKSTLLHLIGFLDKPTSGKIYLEGNDTSKFNESQLAKVRKEKIGFIFQSYNLYPSFTAKQNIELPMILAENRKEERESRTLELLRLVGLEGRKDHFPSQLSGGESQRVAIARALANNPQIILADEPTGNLDSRTGEDIIKLLSNLNKSLGVTLILITHNLDISKSADRTIVLRDGKISVAK